MGRSAPVTKARRLNRYRASHLRRSIKQNPKGASAPLTHNSAFGTYSLHDNTTGTDNVAIGQQTLYDNTTGNYNVGVGSGALGSNRTGGANAALGWRALSQNTGSNNTASGYDALYYNTTASGNTANGYRALIDNTTGSNNTALGYETGYYLTTGSNNLLIGALVGAYSSASGLTTGSNNIGIGYNISFPSATASNQLDIGNIIFGTGLTGTGSTVAGLIGIGTTSPASILELYKSNSNTTLTTFGDPALTVTNSNTTDNDFSSLAFRGVNSSGSEFTGSRLSSVFTSHTAGSESGDLAFFTDNAGTIGERARITGAGNFGIGTPTPAHALDVYGDCIAFSGTCINTSAPANVVSYVGTTFKFSANASFSTASATRYLGAANTAVSSTDVARYVATRSGTLQNLYIKASANTFSGTVTFTVMKNGSNTALTAQLTGSGVTTASDTTHSVSVAAGDVLALSMVTSAGSGTITAPFEASFEELVNTNVFSSQWVTFGSSISYATTSETVGIGTTTPYAALEVWGPDAASSTLAFNVVSSASTTVFAVFDGGNAELSGTLSQSSDQRLKTNIQSLDASSTLSLIDQLNPVTFNWIDPDEGTTPQLGFIAQQVQQIFPNLVSTTSATALTPGGTLGLNYIGLISPIVSAIQALYSDVLSLEQTVSGFAQSFTSNTITFNNQLCAKESNGSTICITGDQLATLLATQGSSGSATGSNQSPAAAQPSPSDASTTTESVTQNSASTTPTIPPTITINGDNPAIIEVGDTYADLGATVTDTGPGQAGDPNLGYQTFLNGTLVSNIVINTSQVATDTIDYVATDTAGLTSTSTRLIRKGTRAIVTRPSAKSSPCSWR